MIIYVYMELVEIIWTPPHMSVRMHTRPMIILKN